MQLLVFILRRSFGWCRNVVDTVRHGGHDLRAGYGDRPDGAQSPEQGARQGSVNLNLSNPGGGHMGGLG